MLRECSTDEETIELALEVAKTLVPGDVVCLYGELGAGKTTFAKGLIEGLNVGIDRKQVTSPTFVTLNLYEHVAHFDLYRLESLAAFKRSGFEEFLEEPYIAIIEWPQIIEALLPSHTLRLTIETTTAHARKIREAV